jgi:NitT/TauT family transport system permease protein
VFGAVTWRWPNKMAGFNDWAYTEELGIVVLGVSAALLLLALTGGYASRSGPLQRAVAALRQPVPGLSPCLWSSPPGRS